MTGLAFGVVILLAACGAYYALRANRTYSLLDAGMAVLDFTLAIGLLFALLGVQGA